MSTLVEDAGVLFAVTDRDGIIRFVNESSALLLSSTRDELLGSTIFDLIGPNDVPRSADLWEQMLSSPRVHIAADYWITGPGGDPVCLEIVGTNLLGDPAMRGVAITGRDITERARMQGRADDLARVLATTTAIDDLMIHATDEPSILRGMTRLLVEQGGHSLAVVATAGPLGGVIPLAFHGQEDGYFASVPDDGDRPLLRALTSGEIQLVNDVMAEPASEWRTEALQRGFRSVVVFPVELADRRRAVLGLAASEVDEFDPAEVRLLGKSADDLTFTLAVLRTRQDLERARHRADVALEAVTRSLANALEQRDPYTAGHQRRVAAISAAISSGLGIPSDDIVGIEVAATIHDLGKIAIPAEILSHPGRLSPSQTAMLREHSQVGHDIVAETEFPWPVAEMILQHHERMNGTGYPNGLRADEILIGARILAVADVVEAMASHRPYRPAHSIGETMHHLVTQRGELYDPDVVDALLTLHANGTLQRLLELR